MNKRQVRNKRMCMAKLPNQKQKELMQEEHEKLVDLLLLKLLLYRHTFLNNDSELKVNN
jgi:hypothetical protein